VGGCTRCAEEGKVHPTITPLSKGAPGEKLITVTNLTVLGESPHDESIGAIRIGGGWGKALKKNPVKKERKGYPSKE